MRDKRVWWPYTYPFWAFKKNRLELAPVPRREPNTYQPIDIATACVCGRLFAPCYIYAA